MAEAVIAVDIQDHGSADAPTIIEYNWYIDGRRIDLGVTSTNPDHEIVRAESDAIARSIH